jgi:UDP-N-acetylglucosamine 2-epimerase (non-hydrolysing)
MKKILTVLGARPQFIKSKPLSDILRHHGQIREVIVHTGQHYDFCMYDVFLKELNLPRPNYFLGINRGDNASQVWRMLEKLANVIEKENPDLVLVYGDTNSTLAGALAAKQKNIALAHIEAGMRSFDLNLPEELNRVITDRIADLLFVPVKEGMDNLEKEGRKRGVFLVGDVLCDVLLIYKNQIKKIFHQLKNKLDVEERKYCFLTLHRQDAVDNSKNLELLLRHIAQIKSKIIFAIHPRTKKRVRQYGLGEYLKENIQCIPPLSYLETVSLIRYARLVLTDSGGAQREAYILKTPCITLRDETEWRQTLSNGWNRLVKVNSLHLSKLPEIAGREVTLGPYNNIFGNGKAAVKIFNRLEKFMLK